MKRSILMIALLALALTACDNDGDTGTPTVVAPPLPIIVDCPYGQLPDLPGNKCYKK